LEHHSTASYADSQRATMFQIQTIDRIDLNGFISASPLANRNLDQLFQHF